MAIMMAWTTVMQMGRTMLALPSSSKTTAARMTTTMMTDNYPIEHGILAGVPAIPVVGPGLQIETRC
jgi:hypothetical protein